jgi:hypothetical protein
MAGLRPAQPPAARLGVWLQGSRDEWSCRHLRHRAATWICEAVVGSPGPAVVVPGVSRVVAGAGGSPGSLAALRYAEYLALWHGAVLVPVLAWQPPGGDRAARVQREAGLMHAWRDMACQRLGEALAAVWGGSWPEPGVQPQVERGSAGWVLVSVADHPGDVLVLGAGHGGPLWPDGPAPLIVMSSWLISCWARPRLRASSCSARTDYCPRSCGWRRPQSRPSRANRH